MASFAPVRLLVGTRIQSTEYWTKRRVMLSNINGDTVSIPTPYTNEGSDDGSDNGQTAGNNSRRLQSTKVVTLVSED